MTFGKGMDGYEDSYDYQDPILAVIAAKKWDPFNYEVEPTGWVRHLRSDRRRMDCTEDSEEILNESAYRSWLREREQKAWAAKKDDRPKCMLDRNGNILEWYKEAGE